MSRSDEEHGEEARAALRRALEQVVDDLGARLRAADVRIPAAALTAVSEALTAAYVRGLEDGLRQASRDLEVQMAALGLDLRVIVEGPEGAPPAGGA